MRERCENSLEDVSKGVRPLLTVQNRCIWTESLHIPKGVRPLLIRLSSRGPNETPAWSVFSPEDCVHNGAGTMRSFPFWFVGWTLAVSAACAQDADAKKTDDLLLRITDKQASWEDRGAAEDALVKLPP